MGYIKTKDGEIAAGVSRQEFNKALYIMRSTLQEYGDVKAKLKSCPVSAEDFDIEDGINTSLPVYKYHSKDMDKFRLRRFITDVSDRYKKIDALKNFITVYTKKPKDSGEWYVYIGVNRRGEKKIIKQAKKELGESTILSESFKNAFLTVDNIIEAAMNSIKNFVNSDPELKKSFKFADYDKELKLFKLSGSHFKIGEFDENTDQELIKKMQSFLLKVIDKSDIGLQSACDDRKISRFFLIWKKE